MRSIEEITRENAREAERVRKARRQRVADARSESEDWGEYRSALADLDTAERALRRAKDRFAQLPGLWPEEATCGMLAERIAHELKLQQDAA